MGNTVGYGLCAVACVAACGGSDDPLGEASQIASWANASSALGAFEGAREVVAFADGEHTYPDPLCPVNAIDGTTTVVMGGCSDSQGRAWTGRATVVAGAGGAQTVTLDGFGNDAFGGPAATTGTVTIAEQAADQHTFVVDMVSKGGIETTVEYSGSVAGTYDARTTWNGSGTITRDGDFFDGGTIEATTVDQVRDNAVCAGEGVSGTTTMTSGDHVVVITYDGATACDSDHSARWSRDGADQGVVKGVTCNAGGSGGGAMLVLIAGALYGPVRRRWRRRR